MKWALAGLQKFPFGSIREDINDSTMGAFVADNFDVVIRGAKLIPGDWDDKFGSFQDRIESIKRRVGDIPGTVKERIPGY